MRYTKPSGARRAGDPVEAEMRCRALIALQGIYYYFLKADAFSLVQNLASNITIYFDFGLAWPCSSQQLQW
jgi:hypothetical protein